MEIERPRHADHRELEQHQNQSAREQIPRERTFAAEFLAEHVGRRTGQECEGRGDEVGDPAGEEDAGHRPAGRHTGIDSNVIDCHEDHGDAAGYIDGVDTRARPRDGEVGGVRSGERRSGLLEGGRHKRRMYQSSINGQGGAATSPRSGLVQNRSGEL